MKKLSMVGNSEKFNQEQEVQQEIYNCIDNYKSFCFDAGAGAGKTYALQETITYILENYFGKIKRKTQKILCITYTNEAKNEIINRIGRNSEVIVTTIHDFLWDFIANQQLLLNLVHKEKLEKEVISLNNEISELTKKFEISNKKEEFDSKIKEEPFLKAFYEYYTLKASDFRKRLKPFVGDDGTLLSNIGNFKKYVNSTIKLTKYNEALNKIENHKNAIKISYLQNRNRDRLEDFKISHDTLLEYAEEIIIKSNLLKKLLSDTYPYILIDEYQDTSPKVVATLMSVLKYKKCRNENDFLIVFFGDKAQKIYDQGVGEISDKSLVNIQKEYNRRSTEEIIDVVNKIRNDNLKQKSIYDNFSGGSCKFYYVQSDFNFKSFIQNLEVEGDSACLTMKNEEIAEYREFEKLYSSLRNYKRFQGQRFQDLNTEFLGNINNLKKMGWFLRELLALVDFIKKANNSDTVVGDLLSFLDKKPKVTYKDVRIFLNQIAKINRECTLKELIMSVQSIKGILSGEEFIKGIFSTDGNTMNYIINSAYRYLNLNDTEESTQNISVEEFFELSFKQFENWYDYVYREDNNDEMAYYTLHGAKGLQFKNVVVIISDKFAKRKNYFSHYFKYYWKNINNMDENDAKYYKEARNLLYVACSRAIRNLHVIYITNDIDGDIKNTIEHIFGEIEEITN